MVFYFTSNVVTPPVTIFMGVDKYESACHVEFDPKKSERPASSNPSFFACFFLFSQTKISSNGAGQKMCGSTYRISLVLTCICDCSLYELEITAYHSTNLIFIPGPNPRRHPVERAGRLLSNREGQ
jgi:hypothetical protein